MSTRRTSPQKLISAYDTIHNNGSWKEIVAIQLLATSSVVKGPSISENGRPSISKILQREKYLMRKL